MTQEQFNQLIQILGETGSFAYKAALQRSYADAISSLFIFFMIVIGFVWLLKFGVPIYRKNTNDWEYGDKSGIKVLATITTLLIGAASMFHLLNSLLILGAPEYYALNLLADFVK